MICTYNKHITLHHIVCLTSLPICPKGYPKPYLAIATAMVPLKRSVNATSGQLSKNISEISMHQYSAIFQEQTAVFNEEAPLARQRLHQPGSRVYRVDKRQLNNSQHHEQSAIPSNNSTTCIYDVKTEDGQIGSICK